MCKKENSPLWKKMFGGLHRPSQKKSPTKNIQESKYPENAVWNKHSKTCREKGGEKEERAKDLEGRKRIVKGNSLNEGEGGREVEGELKDPSDTGCYALNPLQEKKTEKE